MIIKLRKLFLLIVLLVAFYYLQNRSLAQQTLPSIIVISEISWSGTKASANDEWIELFNPTDNIINLDNWGLYEQGGEVLIITLKGAIPPKSYYLVERTDDNVVSNVLADLVGPFGGNGLSNSGEHLVLKNAEGLIIDELNFSSGWPAGSGFPDYRTMERINVLSQGSDSNNWQTYSHDSGNGIDAKGNTILGTPRYAVEKQIITSTQQISTTTESFQEQSPSFNTQNRNPVSTNKPPVFNVPNNLYLLAGEKLNLDLFSIQDPENENLEINWNFGDGSVYKGSKFEHIYYYPGRYTITILARDSVNEAKISLIAYVYPKNIFINEFMPNPLGKDKGAEWIELYNQNNFPVDLSDYILHTQTDKFIIPKGTLLLNESFLVLPNKNTGLSLKNNNGTIKLLTPEGFLLQEINYQDVKEGIAVARKNDKYFLTQIPTPAMINIIYFKNDKTPSSDDQLTRPESSFMLTSSTSSSLNLISFDQFKSSNEAIYSYSQLKNNFSYIASKPKTDDLDNIKNINPFLSLVYQQDIINKLKPNFSFNPNNIIVIILFILASGIISYLFIYRRADYIKIFKRFLG